MKHEKIIRKVKSKLSGNFNDDKKFLLSQYRKYGKHPEKDEIYIKIIDVLYDSLEDGIEKKFIGYMFDFKESVYDTLSDEKKKDLDNEISKLIFKGLLDDNVSIDSIVPEDYLNSDFLVPEEYKKFNSLVSNANGEFSLLVYDAKSFMDSIERLGYGSLFVHREGDVEDYINYIIFDALTSENKNNSYFIFINSVSKVFDYIIHLSKHEKIEESINYLDGFTNIMNKFFKKKNQVEYHCFNNSIEEIIFNEYFKTSKKVVNISNVYNLSELYYFYGVTLLDYDEFDKGVIMLKKALELNPVNVDIIFVLIEYYKSQKDFDNILPLIKESLKFAYSSDDLGILYDTLGEYYLEKLDFNLVYASFKASLEYLGDSDLIQFMEGIPNDFKVDEDFVKVLESENIPSGPNPFVLDTLKDLAEKAESDNEIDEAIRYNEMYYDLALDEEV